MIFFNLFPFALLTFINVYVLYQVMALFFDLNGHGVTTNEALRYAVYFAGAFSSFYIFDHPQLYIAFTVISVGLVAHYYSHCPSEVMLAMLLYLGILVVVEMIPLLLCVQIGFLTGITVYDGNIAIVLFLQKIGLLIALVLLQSHTSKKKAWLPRPFTSYLLTFLVVVIHLVALGINAQLPFLARFADDGRLGLSVILAISLLLCMVLFERIHMLYQTNVQMAFQDHERKIYQRQLHHIEAHQNTVRQVEHDIKKHFSVLQALAAEGNIKAVQHYLQDYLGGFQSVLTKVSTGHIIFDVLISDALQRARHAQIELRTDIRIDEAIHVENHDLTTILSNLIENALQAVEPLPQAKRWIDLRLVTKKGQLFIETKNPYDIDRRLSVRHGLGLKNVAATAKKYRGDVDVRKSSDVFYVSVYLYL